jgi:feruloyl esterase
MIMVATQNFRSVDRLLSSPGSAAGHVEKMGRDAADETVELFLAPGVGHCAGGAGPDQVDLLKALSTWLESGTPPSRQNLVLTEQDKSGEPVMTRPMCKYPGWPHYKGTGDVNAASSFECSME